MSDILFYIFVVFFNFSGWEQISDKFFKIFDHNSVWKAVEFRENKVEWFAMKYLLGASRRL